VRTHRRRSVLLAFEGVFLGTVFVSINLGVLRGYDTCGA
jgi:hypothetical protein